MRWQCVFLVCEDHGDDINYVIARIPSGSEPLDEDWQLANSEVEKGREKFPNSSFYITMEKVPVSSEQSWDCFCGKGIGVCVGDLSCKCSPVSTCKRVDQEEHNPMEYWKEEEAAIPASNLSALTEEDLT